ncbi:molybdate ABC transporter substrate-binding protein [Rubinisphaera margarita]|uniref:molybdate ABC transporter substrate-binding protein n=1 Tax=Rubinisphaera margarita TaxID=2909586 RepID=UPI001EE94A56|nr:molybdate ABC transporter substrate-binding protein [Rubinisphaera margarita]MCG6156396.1 molybdate ABC transporter substrate-binding protein [Rubinisphaera margarita]
MRVLSAASTAEAMKAVIAKFGEQFPNVRVRLSTGPSNGLARQIQAGAPAGLFLSANTDWAEALDGKGLLQQRTNLLANRLVLIVPEENPANVESPADLIGPNVQRVAIACENVPAGLYARQALEKHGLYETLESEDKIARGSDVRVTLAYVERGEADAAIVYATDARIASHVKVVMIFAPEDSDPILYPLVLLAEADENTKQFFKYLQSPEAAVVFEEHGFTAVAAAKTIASDTSKHPGE